MAWSMILAVRAVGPTELDFYRAVLDTGPVTAFIDLLGCNVPSGFQSCFSFSHLSGEGGHGYVCYFIRWLTPTRKMVS